MSYKRSRDEYEAARAVEAPAPSLIEVAARRVRARTISSALSMPLRPFDPATMRPGSTILVAGARRTGKSFALRDLMWHLRNRVYDCYVFSGTRDEEHPWSDYTPTKYVTDVQAEFPNDVLQDVLQRQLLRKEIALAHGVSCPQSLFVFEDLEFLKKSMWKQQSIRTVMFNGRWYRCAAIAAVQYIMEIDMAVRSMFDYAIFTRCPVRAVRERIWKQYAGVFDTFEQFEAAFADCTANHGVMVIDCRAETNRISDSVFHYRAEDHGAFRVGVDEVWDPRVDGENLWLRQHPASGADSAAEALMNPTPRVDAKRIREAGVAVTLLEPEPPQKSLATPDDDYDKDAESEEAGADGRDDLEEAEMPPSPPPSHKRDRPTPKLAHRLHAKVPMMPTKHAAAIKAMRKAKKAKRPRY